MVDMQQKFTYVMVPENELKDITDWTLPEMQTRIHEWAVRKEWRGENAETQRTTGDDIALICSEAAEALEAFRECGDPNRLWWTYDVEVEGVKFKHCSLEQLKILFNCDDLDDVYSYIDALGLTPKPQGVGPELADILVRILDYCEEHGISLLENMQMVLHHNESREVRHGGKYL